MTEANRSRRRNKTSYECGREIILKAIKAWHVEEEKYDILR